MQIENHKEEVPFAHYCERFAALDPQEAAARTGTPFENGAFRITLLGHPYRITHPEFSISGEGGTALKSLPAQTFLMRWLLEGKQTAGAACEGSEQAAAGRVLQRAAFSFGTRLEAFRAACTAMGGLPLQAGDAGFEFTLLGNYRLRMLLWAGDDEFPPSAQLLYSANFVDGFAAEDRVVAGDLLCNEIKANL